MHLRNQTRQILEIKIVIREIKRDKFKIKMTQLKTKRIFPFNHRQDIKIIEDKKRIRHSILLEHRNIKGAQPRALSI